MSVQVGTNVKYESEAWLDERQNLAKNKNDLLNWSKLVPEGYELCLDKTWYYYNSNLWLEDTGHWIPRVSTSLEDTLDLDRPASMGALKESILESREREELLSEQIDELDYSLNPPKFNSVKADSYYHNLSSLEERKQELLNNIDNLPYSEIYDINNDGVTDSEDKNLINNAHSLASESLSRLNGTGTETIYTNEIGVYLIPKITWKVLRKGAEVNLLSATVTGSTKGIINDSFTSFGSLTGIGKNTSATTYTYTIKAKVRPTLTISQSVSFSFKHKILTGTGSLDLISEGTVFGGYPQGFTSKWANDGTLSKTTFDCSGGKYPYILIPSDLYGSRYGIYVGGFLNSDFNVLNIQIINPSGVTINYKALRTGSIQYGSSIPIEIK